MENEPGDTPRPTDKPPPTRPRWNASSFLFLVIAVAVVLILYSWLTASGTSEIPIGTFDEQLEKDNIAKVKVKGMEIYGEFKNEPITRIHQKRNIGCARCHGQSAAHVEQQGAAPPDHAIARAAVDHTCSHCHHGGCKSPTGRTAAGTKVCTDCHGKHRRTVAGG